MIQQTELPWCMYVRTSTYEQGQKSSPLKQFMANVSWAKTNNKVIPGIESAVINNRVQRTDYIFVDASTGTDDRREDLQRFLALARSGKIGGVVCYVTDRIARNLADALRIYRELKQVRVGLQFALQNFDDTPSGVLMYQVFCAFSEYECKVIAERTHDGLRKRILGIGGKKDGKPRIQGPPLYGYCVKDGIPAEDAKEGPIARLFLRMALDTDNTSGKIAAALNATGYRTRSGKLWCDATISKLLRKAHVYAGVYRHRHGIEGALKAHREAIEAMGKDAPALDISAIEVIEVQAYPPLINVSEANLILARVEKNRVELRGRPTKQYPLSGKLWCDVCGCRWYAHLGVYFCSCTRHGKPRCRARATVAQDLMDGAVLDGMRTYLKRPEVHYALAVQDYNASRGSSARSREDVEKQVRALAKEQAHYDEQATAYDLTPKQREIARRKSKQLELRVAELNAELRQLSSVIPLPSESGIVAAFGQILAILDRITTFEERREFVEATIRRALTDGRQVKVIGTLDVQAIENKGSKAAIYSSRNLDAGLNTSAPIPFTFNVPIPAPQRAARKRRVA